MEEKKEEIIATTQPAEANSNVTIPQKPIESESKEAPETAEDHNWKAFREARKKDRAEKEAAEKRASEKEAEASALKAAMEAAFAREARNTQRIDPSTYESDETEDERIEKKVQAALAAREAQAERARNEREQQEYPQRLAREYPDFHQMINSENLDYLEYHYPEVASPLRRLPDNYEKWLDIYRAVRKFVPNGVNAKKESDKATANLQRPKSMSSTGISQVGEASGGAKLTEERKAANWERMQKLLKGLS